MRNFPEEREKPPQDKVCVYCGKTIFWGDPCLAVMGGDMHPQCAQQFEREWDESMIDQYAHEDTQEWEQKVQ